MRERGLVLAGVVLALVSSGCSTVQRGEFVRGLSSCSEAIAAGEAEGWCLAGSAIGAALVGGVVASSAAADL